MQGRNQFYSFGLIKTPGKECFLAISEGQKFLVMNEDKKKKNYN